AKETRDNLPEMLRAASLLIRSHGPAQFLIPLAPTLTAEQHEMARALVARHGPNLPVRLIADRGAAGAVSPTAGGARATLFHARASIVASGTATVEAALIGNPFVVVYRVSPLTYAIAQRVVTVPHVAMANLIAGRRVVPELIQGDFTAARIVQHLAPLLPEGKPRESMKKELDRIRELLTSHPARGAPSAGAIDRVADIALAKLGLASPVPETVSS
ncbi:MAG: hypothetical protein WCA37_02200, partial [Terracidiphilus sp.]